MRRAEGQIDTRQERETLDVRLQETARRARRYFESARAPATVRAYASDLADFETWCKIEAGGLRTLPAAPETVALYMTVFQERTTPEIRGRVLGVMNALSFAAIPLGMTLGGVLIEGAGLTPTLIGMGLIYLALTLCMFFNPALHEMNSTPFEEAPYESGCTLGDDRVAENNG